RLLPSFPTRRSSDLAVDQRFFAEFFHFVDHYRDRHVAGHRRRPLTPFQKLLERYLFHLLVARIERIRFGERQRVAKWADFQLRLGRWQGRHFFCARDRLRLRVFGGLLGFLALDRLALSLLAVVEML